MKDNCEANHESIIKIGSSDGKNAMKCQTKYYLLIILSHISDKKLIKNRAVYTTDQFEMHKPHQLDEVRVQGEEHYSYVRSCHLPACTFGYHNSP